MIKRYLLLLLLFLPVMAFSQAGSTSTATDLDNVLEKSELSYAEAVRFVLAEEDGFERAIASGWLPKGTKPDGAIKLGELSFLLMKTFDMKGGFMYAILPGPRYAYREMVSRSLIQGAADPAMKVSGERFLTILGNVLGTAEGEK